jgi:hypothetical protein
VAFQFEDLFEIGPIQIIFELAAHRESARFQSSVTLFAFLGSLKFWAQS